MQFSDTNCAEITGDDVKTAQQVPGRIETRCVSLLFICFLYTFPTTITERLIIKEYKIQ